MRILHVHSGNRYGGVETFLRVMAHMPPRAQIESEFALSYDARLAQEIRAEGGLVHILGDARASRPLGVLRARANLVALFRQKHFDATMAHSAWALSLLAHGGKRPLVFYQHDIFQGDHWTEKLARHVRPDLILANSAYTSKTSSRVFPGRSAHVIYPPADLPVAPLPPAERLAIRDRLSAKQACVVLLIAARFEEWKGHHLLLQALGLLRRNPNWELWIAGEAQTAGERALRDGLRETASTLDIHDRIQFLGHVPNIAALMQASDIYCQPNTGPEPFGLAFVEALASGLPVIATPLGGVREILEPVWGLLASPTPQTVAAMIERLLDDPALRSRLGALGRARATDLCDPETQMAAIGKTIASLLARKAA